MPSHWGLPQWRGCLDWHADKWDEETGQHHHMHLQEPPGTHSSDAIANHATALIARHAANGARAAAAAAAAAAATETVADSSAPQVQPLFLYLPFVAPHLPTQVASEWASFNDHMPAEDPPWQAGGGPEQPPPAPDSTTRREYAGMVSHMDAAIGRVVAAMEQHGLWQNTLLLALSDNGGALNSGASNFPFRGGCDRPPSSPATPLFPSPEIDLASHVRPCAWYFCPLVWLCLHEACVWSVGCLFDVSIFVCWRVGYLALQEIFPP